jgi:hypothetical protein
MRKTSSAGFLPAKRLAIAALVLMFAIAAAAATPGGAATAGDVAAAAVKVVISPATSMLQGNETQQFTAAVTNATNKAVTWKASGGVISATGLYKAGTTLGAFSATATSVQDPTKSATTAITIGKTTTIDHPRIILDAPTLTTLRARAQAGTAEWTAIKADCDSYIGGGSVLFPGQNGYPDPPSVGEGYQGDGYVGVLMPLGLCYYTTLASDPATAAKYGAKAVAILLAMSNPQYFTIDGTPIWDRDDGYGIRNYGVGMGIGYDWFHSLLTSAQQQQIQTALSHWINGFENDSSDNFEYVQPVGNYYAGYYAAKCFAGLAVEGDSTLGDAWWSDWYNNQHLKRVAPFYAVNLAGGGWPEGFAAYGPLASRNLALPALAVRTAKGIDIIHGKPAYPFPLDQARWLMHFTWPSLDFVDDRDTVHSGDSDTIWPGTGDPNSYSFFAGFLAMWSDPLAPAMHKYARNAKAALASLGVAPADQWIEFLFWDDAASEASYATGIPSHLSPGIGEMTARSDWTTAATWMSFRSGPYVNNPGAGHQGFDAGSLALVRGKNPLLVNPGGWFTHNPNGTAGETLVYNDWFGNWDADPTLGNRTLFNNFQVRHLDGHGAVLDNYGQWALQRSDGVNTAITGFEDAEAYVFALGRYLGDMYRPFQTICAGESPIVADSRQIIYLRPSQFVVYDRTVICDASLDQYLAFHFPANPVEVAAPAVGVHRFNVTTATFAGSMTTILPANAKIVTTDKLSTDTTTFGKVWRTEIRPASAGPATRQWMTVFDLSPTASQVALATAVKIVSGTAVGALLQSAAGNSVVVSGTATPGNAISGTLSYKVPAMQTRHVITDLTPSAGYTISVSVSGGDQTVSLVKGGGSNTSANGVLTFETSAGGQLKP